MLDHQYTEYTSDNPTNTMTAVASRMCFVSTSEKIPEYLTRNLERPDLTKKPAERSLVVSLDGGTLA